MVSGFLVARSFTLHLAGRCVDRNHGRCQLAELSGIDGFGGDGEAVFALIAEHAKLVADFDLGERTRFGIGGLSGIGGIAVKFGLGGWWPP